MVLVLPASGVSEEGQSGSGAAELEEPVQNRAVVLENVPEKVTRELLAMVVENICSVTEDDFSLEMIQDINTAVVSFAHHSVAAQFLAKCDGHKCFKQHRIRAWALEPTRSMRVENLPPQAVEELLELYFEKEREGGGKVEAIKMLAEERAAIITFQDPKVTETVQKREHLICKAPVRVYPYYESLGTALYGKERPEWKLPEAFSESLQPALSRFLVTKGQLGGVNEQLRSHFCQVELDGTSAKLSPLPSLLKQKGLTANHIEGWKGNALRVFRSIAARYRCFECSVSSLVWKAAEKEVRQVVMEDAVLLPDEANGVVAIVGLAKDVDRIQGAVEGVVQKATTRIERERNGISEEIALSPGMHYILQQAGLQKAFAQTYPDMSMTYRTDTQRLVLSGLTVEVLTVKSWVLERQMQMKQKPLELNPNLLSFLNVANSEEISQHLFTSHGVSAVYKMEAGEVVLVAACEKALADATQILTSTLTFQDVPVEDVAVMSHREWVQLKTQLTEAYNSTKHNTVCIKLAQPDLITVSGFREPVKEVSDSLRDFINKHSRVEDSVTVRTHAALKFLQENKALEWKSHMNPEEVWVRFEPRRPRVVLGGPRYRVVEARNLFARMVAALCTDQLTIIKPGARKYFLENQHIFSPMMKEHKCVVLLQDENELEAEEDGEEDEKGSGEGEARCQVRMGNGALVLVSKADITRFTVDAVVNASNEDLKHIGGLAAALLQAAGRQLQDVSDKYVHANGQLRPGDAAITEAGRLPCKHVIHAVGPRYSSASHAKCIQLLSRAVAESLALAERHRCTSIALPAISSGIFGFPLELCAKTIAKAVRDHCEDSRSYRSSLNKIHLINNDDKTVTAMTQATQVIVNTISEDLDLSKGAVSKAILQAAGSELQSAVRQEAKGGMANYGDVLQTRGFGLRSHVFHTVCPPWDGGTGRAKQTLMEIVQTCLKEAERHRAVSLAFPAIGTGNMSFPRPLVAKLLLSEVQAFSQRKCFVREFRGQSHGHKAPSGHQAKKSQQAKVQTGQSQHGSAFFGEVSSPTLGVHSMEIGHVTLEVSSGDITKETTDIIVNSSNSTFNLKTGVSKAILDAAGQLVENECSQYGTLQDKALIVTQAGNLECRHIIHIVGQRDPARIREMVFHVLQECEERRASSAAFPALGTGQGGANPSLVAEAMIDAISDFVAKRQGRVLKLVKIVVFQTDMVSKFHTTMKKREGGNLPEEKSIFSRVKGRESVAEEEEFVMVGEEFSPTIIQLCGDTPHAVRAAKDTLNDLIVKEQMERDIRDPGIAHLSSQQRDTLMDLQRRLTIRIRRGEASLIRLEGLTRDVLTADADIRQMIREAELAERRRRDAALVSSLVEWQYEHRGSFTPFDIFTNLTLEEAFENKRSRINVRINNAEYEADLVRKEAFLRDKWAQAVSLKRIEKNDTVALPSTWGPMGGSGLKEVVLLPASQEYQEVAAEFTRTGLANNIVKIVRIQNESLWKGYQVKKASLDSKNGNSNNERRLFHGTHGPSVDHINNHGFNRSYAGKHAAVYGNGTYFAVDPKYSASSTYSSPDAQGHRHMYLALVLVGEFTVGSQGMVVPPAKNPGKSADMYDSVVDKTASPTMFIIFNDVQAYPSYLIVFT
ncbi:hypothetical protein JZ751_004560 [Albula glossodonta]|uniref:Poly [ADP-ribose] polymerase n=1 Tax=Albula glossodonta TaxID=121402 RepID=A0A8T2N5I3_9TELE|nr:hypothetical protein JZ751_004560 [Albula glossodonta]